MIVHSCQEEREYALHLDFWSCTEVVRNTTWLKGLLFKLASSFLPKAGMKSSRWSPARSNDSQGIPHSLAMRTNGSVCGLEGWISRLKARSTFPVKREIVLSRDFLLFRVRRATRMPRELRKQINSSAPIDYVSLNHHGTWLQLYIFCRLQLLSFNNIHSSFVFISCKVRSNIWENIHTNGNIGILVDAFEVD